MEGEGAGEGVGLRKTGKCSVHLYPWVRMPIGHRHGNSKEAAGAMSQELGLGRRSIFGSHLLLDKVSSLKARWTEKRPWPGRVLPPDGGQAGVEQAKRRGAKRPMKGRNNIKSWGPRESRKVLLQNTTESQGEDQGASTGLWQHEDVT